MNIVIFFFMKFAMFFAIWQNLPFFVSFWWNLSFFHELLTKLVFFLWSFDKVCHFTTLFLKKIHVYYHNSLKKEKKKYFLWFFDEICVFPVIFWNSRNFLIFEFFTNVRLSKPREDWSTQKSGVHLKHNHPCIIKTYGIWVSAGKNLVRDKILENLCLCVTA